MDNRIVNNKYTMIITLTIIIINKVYTKYNR